MTSTRLAGDESTEPLRHAALVVPTTAVWEAWPVRGGRVGALILSFVAVGCSSAQDLASSTSSTPSVTSEPIGVEPTVALAPATTLMVPTTEVESPMAPGDDLLEQLGLAGATTLTGEDAVVALGVLDDFRSELFRESPGFSATSTFRQEWVRADGSKPEPEPPANVANVTVLGSGDVWAEYANGNWLRFDAAAGLHQGLYTDASDGSPYPLAYQGTPNIAEFGEVIRHQPTQPLRSIGDVGWTRPPDTPKIEVRSTEFEGNAAVEVIVETERLGLQRHLVDLGSGLIVEYQSTEPDVKGSWSHFSSLTDVAEARVLPVSVTPALPDGAEWQTLSSPVDRHPTTVREAREAFGSGLILPQSAVEAGVVAMEYSADGGGTRGTVSADDPDGGVRWVNVQHVEPIGLMRTVFASWTYRPGLDGAIPEEYEPYEDRLCLGSCTPPLVESPSTIVPESGALAGITLQGDNGNFGVMLDGVHLSIEAPTTSEALEMANSLTVVDHVSTTTPHDTATD